MPLSRETQLRSRFCAMPSFSPDSMAMRRRHSVAVQAGSIRLASRPLRR